MSAGAGGLSPLDRPVSYPGVPLRMSGLLTGAGFAPGDDLPAGALHPVLAIGSNADPAQLRRKLGPRLQVPVTAVTVTGLAVGHSAHVSPPGYLPYAPWLSPGVLPAVVLWLDDDALAVLDRTEPNYRRVPCPAPVAGATTGATTGAATSAEPYHRCEVYRSRWGLLRDPPGGAPLPAGDQAAAYDALARRSWFAGLVPEIVTGVGAAVEALRTDPNRREALRRRLAAEGAAGDGWP